MDYMRDMEDNAYDLAIVDPPYYSGPEKRKYYGKKVSSINVKRRDYGIADKWFVPTQEYYDEICRVSIHQILWGVNYFRFEGLSPGRIIWDKCNKNSSFSDAEIAACTFHDSVRLFQYMWNGMMQGKSIKEGHIQQGNKKLNETRIHPTQKPVVLYKWLLENYAKPGDKILDTHGGSGSIAIACLDMGFDLTIIEKDAEYYNKMKARIDRHRSQLQMF